MKILLARGRGIDVMNNPRNHSWNYGTAAEMARKRGKNQLADLIDEYDRNPAEVMSRMRNLLSFPFSCF